MIKNVHPTQVISWITKIEKNLEKFDLYDEDTSKEEGSFEEGSDCSN